MKYFYSNGNSLPHIDKFTEGLSEVIEFIKNANPELLPLPDAEDDKVTASVDVADEVKEATDQEEPVAEADGEDAKDESAGTDTGEESTEAEPEAKTEDKNEEKVEVEETISNKYTSDVEFEDLEDAKEN